MPPLSEITGKAVLLHEDFQQLGIVGGSFGLDDSIKNKADLRLSMSEMTFPHHLARVMLAEQIYRGFKINEGSRYHK